MSIKQGASVDSPVQYHIAVLAVNTLLEELRSNNIPVPLDNLIRNLKDPNITEDKFVKKMLQLEPQCHYLLRSRYIANLTDSDIARSMGVEVRRVMAITQRCLDHLLNSIS
jgi:DNA-directed RNA polymerase specialized sigma24 family protein